MSAVTPLSQSVLDHLMVSNFLNPYPYKLRHVEDRGSIKKTLEAAFPVNQNDLYSMAVSGRERLPIRPLYDRILRKTALIISAIATAIFLPPIGFLYHLSMTVSLLALNILKKFINISNSDCTKDRIFQHLDALYYELLVTCTSFLTFGLYSSFAHADTACNPQKRIPYFYYFKFFKKEETCLLKAISLRNDLGIVKADGGLCTWNKEDDEEIYTTKNGHYETMISNLSYKLLLFISQFNKELPLNSRNRLPSTQADIDSFLLSPVQSVIAELQKPRSYYPKPYDNPDLLRKKITDLENLDTSLTYFRKILLDCVNTDEKHTYTLPKFWYKADYVKSHFEIHNYKKDNWVLFIKKANRFFSGQRL